MLSSNQRFLLYNAFFFAAYAGFNGSFVSAFALAFGASNLEIGIIGALPYIAVLFSQIPGEKLSEYIGRLRTYTIFSFFSRLFWIPLLLVPFYPYPVFFIMVFFFIIQFLEFLTDPSFHSMAAEVVPERTRGSFFGLKNMVREMVMAVCMLAAGFYLDKVQGFAGFSSLFVLGSLFGLISVFSVRRLNVRDGKNNHHHLSEFFQTRGSFRLFLWLMFVFNFAFMFASPFFTVYMLKNLQMDYTFFALANAATLIVRTLAMPHFGRLSDKYGDRNIAVITSIGTAIVPLLFLFVHPETSWLAIPIFMLSGFVWAGVDLTFYNLLLDVTEEKSRAVQIAEYGIMTSVPMIVAPVIGGFVADATGSWILGGIPFLFAVSSVLRIFAGALLFRLPEPRAKREFEFKEVLRKTMAFHPEKGVLTMIRTLHKFRSGRL